LQLFVVRVHLGEFAANRQRLLEGGERAGRIARPELDVRDPVEIERSIMPGAKEAVAKADAYVAEGITTLIVGVSNPDEDLNVIRDLVAWRDSR